MAITPAAGYIVDPNNPNGVIKAGTAVMPGSSAAIQQSNAQPSIAIGAVNNNSSAIPPAPLAPQNTPLAQTPAINTTQPSPTTVNATPYTGNSIVDALSQGGQASDFASRTKLAQTYGIQGYTGSADQNMELLNKYKSGLQTAQSSNVPTPQTQGQGSAMVNGITGGATPMPQVNPIDTVLAQDKGYNELLQSYKDFTSSESQKESLTSEYERLTKDAGIEGINSELINDKNIIDGTEQDIRNEISAVGGFATEGQVQALASARNKTLISNYNNLLQTRDNAVSHINTMIGLSQQDRQYSQQQLENNLNFQQQISSYTDKFTKNAQESLKNVQATEGWDGIYKAAMASGDPAAIDRINAIMGPGFDIKAAAIADAQARTAQMQTQQLQQQQAQLNLTKTKQEIANGNKSPTVPTQVVDLGNGNKVLINTQTGAVISNISGDTTSPLPYNGNYKSPTDYVNAVLSKQGVSYDIAVSNTPKGLISAINNANGQTVTMTAADWAKPENKGAFTPIYNNTK